MGYTSPRFAAGHYSTPRSATPGPGAYAAAESDSRTLSHAATSGTAQYGTAGHSARTTGERRLEFGTRDTPGPGAYSSARGMGEQLGSRGHATPGSAAFASRSSRMQAKQTLSQGPLAYADAHYRRGAMPTANAAAVASAHRPTQRQSLRRSASFESASSRFKTPAALSPGPGAYYSCEASGMAMSSPRRSHPTSAVFSSTSARTQLPKNPMSEVTPGAGAYEHAQPIEDYRRSREIRRSASFESTSRRNLGGVSRAAAATPPPGAYGAPRVDPSLTALLVLPPLPCCAAGAEPFRSPLACPGTHHASTRQGGPPAARRSATRSRGLRFSDARRARVEQLYVIQILQHICSRICAIGREHGERARSDPGRWRGHTKAPVFWAKWAQEPQGRAGLRAGDRKRGSMCAVSLDAESDLPGP